MPAAIPLIGAGLGVASGLAVGGLAGGLMIAGGALAGVGAITGNKKLTMLGAVLGLGGGLMNATGIGGAASATDAAAAEAAKNGVFNDPLSADVASAQSMDAASTAATTSEAAGTAVDQAMTGASNVDTTASKWGLDRNPAERGDLVSDAMDPAKAYGADSGWNKDVMPSEAAKGAAADAPTGYENGGPSRGVYGQASAPNAPPPAAKSWWDKFSDTAGGAVKWAKDNPELVKTGAGLVQGAMKSYGDEELAKNDMKRQMAYKDWVRQRYSDSVRNLQVPAVVLQPNQGAGIIAQTRT